MGLAALITIHLGLLGYIGMMNDYVNKSTTYMKSQNAMNSTLVEYVNGIEAVSYTHLTKQNALFIRNIVQNTLT